MCVHRGQGLGRQIRAAAAAAARKTHDYCWHLGCILPKSAGNNRANRGSFGPWPSGSCGDPADGYPQYQNASAELCVHRAELMKTFGQGDPRVPPNRANYVLSRENSIVGRTEAVLKFLSKPSTTLGATAGPPASLGPASAWAPFLNATGAPQW